jgi:hypothetical protein
MFYGSRNVACKENVQENAKEKASTRDRIGDLLQFRETQSRNHTTRPLRLLYIRCEFVQNNNIPAVTTHPASNLCHSHAVLITSPSRNSLSAARGLSVLYSFLKRRVQPTV